VAEAARSEVNADPDAVPLVGEDIDVVVAGSDDARLPPRHLFQGRDALRLHAGSSKSS
jgi:hypothetical protein